MWISVLWAGLQFAMWITHVGQISPWPARKVTERRHSEGRSMPSWRVGLPSRAASFTKLVPRVALAQVSRSFRAARLQNETAPEKLLTRHEKRFEKCEKRSEKNDPKRDRKFFSPSTGCIKIFHRRFLRVFHRPKFAQKYFLSPRGSAGVATLTKLVASLMKVPCLQVSQSVSL